jgi:hypothetical protein
MPSGAKTEDGNDILIDKLIPVGPTYPDRDAALAAAKAIK